MKHRSGFSMVEIVIALVILAVGFFPVYNLFRQGSSGTANTVANTVAAALNGEAVTGNKDSDTGVTTYTVTGKAYQSNVDLSSININDANITWEWAYEDSVAANVDSTDAKDTILGDLAAKYIDGKNGTSEFDGDIVTVTKNGTTVDSVTVLTIDNNGLVKEGTSEVGCIMVQFDIDITATQID